jgi:Zn-dependent peptidase ImmA (M78 family)/transcriptional regulator with XRE-family HTH domain
MAHLGGRISRVREAYGFSAEDIAQLSGLPPDRLAAIEAGASLSTVELAVIAGALAVDPAILRSGAFDPRRSPARFRAPLGLPMLAGHDMRTIARGAEVGRVLGFLNELLEKPTSPVVEARAVRGLSSSTEPWRQGYQLGEAAHAKLLPAVGSIESVQELLEHWGVHVAWVRFEDQRIEAASLYERESAPVILLNLANERVLYGPARRAQLAHELCHLLHDGGEHNLLTVVSRESGHADAAEQRAGGFAPSFLAPRDLVKPTTTKPLALVHELASTWGLSFEGAAWHAKNLDLIPVLAAERLVKAGRKPKYAIEFEPKLVRTPPAMFGIEVDPTPLTEGLLSETTLIACSEGLISQARAAEILSLR